MLPILIREMKPSDWQLFQKLNNEVFVSDGKHDDDLDLNWPFSETGISYYKKVCDGKYGAGFIAESEGRPVGYIALSEKNFDYRTRRYVEIENIGVCPAHRSMGIGMQLLNHAELWAQKKGATRLYVEAYSKNTRAISFYKEFGFTDIGLQLEKEIRSD